MKTKLLVIGLVINSIICMVTASPYVLVNVNNKLHAPIPYPDMVWWYPIVWIVQVAAVSFYLGKILNEPKVK